jgi:hypothetical protein
MRVPDFIGSLERQSQSDNVRTTTKPLHSPEHMPDGREQYDFNSMLEEIVEFEARLSSLGFRDNDHFRKHRQL